MGKVRAYLHTRQPLTKPLTFDFIESVKSQIETIEEEAYKWLSCSKSKTLHTVCGFNETDIRYPIDIQHFLAFRALNLLQPDITIMMVDSFPERINSEMIKVYLERVPKHAYLCNGKDENEKKDNRLILNKYVSNFYKGICKKLLLDLLKCLVLVNSTSAPWMLAFTDLVSDYYATKETYIRACKYNGVLILQIPRTIANNRQLSNILQDIIQVRKNLAPTILRCTESTCHYYSESGDKDLLKEAIHKSHKVVKLEDIFKCIYDEGKVRILNSMRRVMILDGWIEQMFDSIEETK